MVPMRTTRHSAAGKSKNMSMSMMMFMFMAMNIWKTWERQRDHLAGNQLIMKLLATRGLKAAMGGRSTISITSTAAQLMMS